jgi:hypothetical protein
VERLIGSARRACIDHVIVFGETHLGRIMARYARYYNAARTHLSLRKGALSLMTDKRRLRINALPHHCALAWQNRNPARAEVCMPIGIAE